MFPGLELGVGKGPRKKPLKSSTGKDIRSLHQAALYADTLYQFALAPVVRAPVLEGRQVLGKLSGALAWAFDDGIEDENDTKLANLEARYANPSSQDALANALDAYATLADEVRELLVSFEIFDVTAIDRARVRLCSLVSGVRIETEPGGVARSEGKPGRLEHARRWGRPAEAAERPVSWHARCIHQRSSRIIMALVDSLLKLMSAQAADVIVIPSTEAPRLERNGEPRPLSMPPLGRDMVEAMVEELVDAPLRQRLARGESVETQYLASSGPPHVVLVEPRGDGPRLTLRRASAEDATRSSTAAPSPGDITGDRRSSGPTAGAALGGPPSAAASLGAPASAAAAHQPSPRPPAFVPAPLEALRDEPLLEPGPLASVLAHADRQRASDILLSHGSNARLRVAGEITELPGHAIDEPTLRAFVAPVLSPRAHHELCHAGSTDLALRVRTEGRPQRYRANLFLQQSGLAMAMRPVRADPPTLDVLNLPDELAELAALPSGLVLMTGTAGSGKSTTLVALIEHINRSAPKHVITLEDPIEYEYKHRRALVHQRQLGVHVSSFSEGLRAALRESPDVILVGEMRDHATMAAALTAAETGHLVLSTLHAADAAMALDRMIDSFPEHQQTQVRYQLAGVLRAVVTQRLLPSRVLPQRVPAIELLRVNTAVATKIREGRGHQIQSEIQKGRADGMLSFEVTLAALVRRGLLAAEMAMAHSTNPALMAEHLRGRG